MRTFVLALFLVLVGCHASSSSCKRRCDGGGDDCRLGPPVPIDGCVTYVDAGPP